MEDLFAEMISLYRLDQISSTGTKANLGELPSASVALIATLVAVWVMIIAYMVFETVKNAKKRK